MGEHRPSDAELDAAFAAAMGPVRQRMSEKDLQDVIRAECDRLGLRVFVIPRSALAGIRGTACGWPDLVIAGERGVIFRELKSRDGETTADQDEWAWLLHHAGLNWGLWRPADWSADRIRAELRALAPERAESPAGPANRPA